MKRYPVLFLLLLVGALNLCAQSEERLSLDRAQKEIMGQWRLLSYQDEAGDIVDYSNQDRIWSFNSNRFTVDSDDLGGRRVVDGYSIIRSKFHIRTTILILNEGLRDTHLPFGKFIVQSIEGGRMNLTDWSNKVFYKLQRVGD